MKQHNKEHDTYVKKRKKEINLQIQEINVNVLEPRKRQQTALQNVRQLEQFINSNTGIRGFFFGSASQTTVGFKKAELVRAKVELTKAEAVVSEFIAKIAKLKTEYNGLKTVKQQQQAISRRM